ncbi:hypothetical protein B566_EDAN014201 [Ephemera danica]|nr:hypothetical protein B566_EDAN014201 [Ephemera danica]
MAESSVTYERREGTDSDHGTNFEWQTTNLAYLRCEQFYRQWVQDNSSGVKSYLIANNVNGIGAIDDVVIRLEYPHQGEDKIKLIFVQCKHFQDPKKASEGNGEIVKLLLQNDPDQLNERDIKGMTAFNMACEKNLTDAVMCLLEYEVGLIAIADNHDVLQKEMNGNRSNR